MREVIAHQRWSHAPLVPRNPPFLPHRARAVQNHDAGILCQPGAELIEQLRRFPEAVIGIGKDDRAES
jgi:hypothetical protein